MLIWWRSVSSCPVRPAVRSEWPWAWAAPGLLLAALHQPVWTSAVHAPADFYLGAGGLRPPGLLDCPPWLVVGLAAAAGSWPSTSDISNLKRTNCRRSYRMRSEVASQVVEPCVGRAWVVEQFSSQIPAREDSGSPHSACVLYHRITGIRWERKVEAAWIETSSQEHEPRGEQAGFAAAIKALAAPRRRSRSTACHRLPATMAPECSRRSGTTTWPSRSRWGPGWRKCLG